jgi:hypothetical protein
MATLQERRLGYQSRAGLEPGTSRFSILRINHYAARGIATLSPLLVRARPRISARIRAEPRPGLHPEDRTVRIVHQGLSRRRDGPSNQPLHATKQTTHPPNQTLHPARHGHDFGAASSRARMLILADADPSRIRVDQDPNACISIST